MFSYSRCFGNEQKIHINLDFQLIERLSIICSYLHAAIISRARINEGFIVGPWEIRSTTRVLRDTEITGKNPVATHPNYLENTVKLRGCTSIAITIEIGSHWLC